MSLKSVQTGPSFVTGAAIVRLLVAGIDSHYQYSMNTSTYFLAYMVNPFLKNSDLLFSIAPLVATMHQNLVWQPLNHISS